MGRSSAALRNSSVAATGQLVVVLAGFVSRTVFVYVLGVEYLGVHSYFLSLLAVFSIAELGVGTAVTYALYRPLIENDSHQVAAVMRWFRRAYHWIAIVVGALGLALLPFLGLLMKDTPSIPHLTTFYVLFLLNSVLSYLLSYSRTLLIASERGHLEVLNRVGFLVLQNVVQIALLLLTGSYFLFLLTQILITVASNIAITVQARRQFPDVFVTGAQDLDPRVRGEIRKNVLGMLFHKGGSAAVAASTALFIGAFVGVLIVGKYANYVLITGMLTLIISQAILAVSPSIGLLSASGGTGAAKQAFDRLFFLNFVLVATVTSCLAVGLNAFVEIWLGPEYVLDAPVVALIVLNFYLYGMRQTSVSFINACGLFWTIRYKSLVEALLLIGLSFTLVGVLHWGMLGALVSVTLVTLATNVWWEPLVVCREVLGRGIGEYLVAFTGYAMVTAVVTAGALGVSSLLPTGYDMIALLTGLAATVVLMGLAVFAVYGRSDNFAYLWEMMRRLRRRLSREGVA